MPKPSSQMPDGGLQPTYASNLMVDGFQFDTDYGAGPKSVRTDPRLPRSTRGLSALPDGFVAAAAEPLDSELIESGEEYGLGDLGGMVREAAPLTDLRWLEEAEQDPARLPHSTNDTVVPELEEAWGVERRTDGRGLVPNKERVLPAASGPVSGLPTGTELRALVASAMRRSAYGDPLGQIATEVASHLGGALGRMGEDPELRAVAAAMRQVRAEHGLAGRLYLRDSAFPGLLTGKWDEVIRRKCAGARYWLASPGSQLARHDRYLGKEVVSEIPWKRALAAYRPELERSGVRVASGGDPKAVLTAALLSSPQVSAPTSPNREAVPDPSDRLSVQEAWRVFASAPPPTRERVALSPSRRAAEKVAAELARFVRAGLLTEADADRLRRFSSLGPKQVLRAAANLVLSSGRPIPSSYRGSGVGAEAFSGQRPTRDAVWASLEESRLEEEARARVARTVESYQKAGSLTAEEARKIVSSGLSAKEMARVAEARVRDVNRRGAIPATPQRPYEGARYVEAPALRHGPGRTADWARVQEEKVAVALRERAVAGIEARVKAGSLSRRDADRLLASDLDPKQLARYAAARAAREVSGTVPEAAPRAQYSGGPNYAAHVPAPRKPAASELEVRGLLHWAAHRMNLGSAGPSFDAELSGRFSETVRTAAEQPLVQLRRKHEGRAGHAYIDAATYASPTGTAGCDRGAQFHRASRVGALLAMPRCSGCAANVGGGCRKYALPLVSSPPPAQPKAPAPALGVSGSAEAPVYDPDEFGLRAEEEIVLEGGDPSEGVDEGDEVSFGGMWL